MPRSKPRPDALKRKLKQALTEVLHEQRDLLHEVFSEVLEDAALARAVQEGHKTDLVLREDVFRIFRGRA